MEILQVIAAAVMCFALLTLLWQIKGRLLRPTLRGHEDECLTVTVTVNGSAPNLEQTVSHLLWLRQNGDLPAGILLVDDGMDLNTAAAARILSEKDDGVFLCTPDQLEFFILRSCNDGHYF